jgi:putative tricarboxylic transport membrane protein
MTRRISVAGLLIGLGFIIAAGVLGYDAWHMRVPPIHAKVGPRVFPILVSCGLAVAGLLLLWQGKTGEFPEAEGETDWRAVGILAAGLLLHMNLLKPAGFIIAGIILFMSVAVAFGSRSYVRDLAVAVVTVAVTYFAFTRLLGLQLPPGLLAWIG